MALTKDVLPDLIWPIIVMLGSNVRNCLISFADFFSASEPPSLTTSLRIISRSPISSWNSSSFSRPSRMKGWCAAGTLYPSPFASSSIFILVRPYTLS